MTEEQERRARERERIAGRVIEQTERFAASRANWLRKGTQREAFGAFIEALESGHRDMHCEIPTGVGKTALFIAAIKNYLDALPADLRTGEDRASALVVVPTKKLVEQTALSFARFMPELAPMIAATDESGHTLDWENAQVGTHYSKRKHGHENGRNIMITTYPSLFRDRDQVLFSPDHYRLVILDEVHAIAELRDRDPEQYKGYVQAVERFRDSALRVGFTATPDFSPEKSVDVILPHRFYTLPLHEAIERGDLCGTRPVLVQTNYEVDYDLYTLNTLRDGQRVLSSGELEKALNVAARNRAAIETYFTYRDPDSDDRLFGQTGLVFCAGRQHAEDMARQFNTAVGEPDFQPLERWLRERDITLAVVLHGNTKRATVRKDGRMQEVGVEEVYDLHAEGKILILTTADLLREGYDNVKDSFVMDMVDRLSLVASKQLHGRALRLDEEDPQKFSTHFNFIDRNHYELVRDHPQMLPIHYAELLGEDFEFRRPGKRPGLYGRFKDGLPPEVLKESQFGVESDYHKVREVARTHRERRAEIDIPWLPDDKQQAGWATGGTLLKSLSLGKQRIGQLRTVLKEIYEEAFDNANPPRVLRVGNEEKPFRDLVGRFRNSSNVDPEGVIYVHPDLVPEVGRRMGLAPVLPEEKIKEGWTTGTAVLRAMRAGSTPEIIGKLYDVAETLYNNSLSSGLPQSTVIINGEERPLADLIGRFRHGSSVPEGLIYVHPDLVPEVGRRMGFAPVLPEEKIEEGWITGIAILKAINIPHDLNERKILTRAVEDLYAEATAGEAALRAIRVDGEERPLADLIGRFRKRGSDPGGYVYVHPALLPEVLHRMGFAPVLPEEKIKEGWTTGTAVLRALRVGSNLEIQKLYEVTETLYNNSLSSGLSQSAVIIDGEERPLADLIGRFRNGSSVPEGLIYVHPDLVPEVGHRMGFAPVLPDEKKKEGWITGAALLKSMGISMNKRNFDELAGILEALHAEATADDGRARTVSIGGEECSLGDLIGRYRARGIVDNEGAIYIHPDLVPEVQQRMGRAPMLPKDKDQEGWITCKDILKTIRIANSEENYQKLAGILEALHAEATADDGRARTVSIGGEECSLGDLIGRYRSKRIVNEGGIYIHPDLVPEVQQRMGRAPEGEEQSEARGKWSAQVGRQAIDPDSEHIRQRTGRSRSRHEDS